MVDRPIGNVRQYLLKAFGILICGSGFNNSTLRLEANLKFKMTTEVKKMENEQRILRRFLNCIVQSEDMDVFVIREVWVWKLMVVIVRTKNK